MQKTIGIIGGLTWHSTLVYYRLLNQITNERLGGAFSAKILLYSVNFEEIKQLTYADNWDGIAGIMIDVAQKLEQAGADCILLGANTMHHIADRVSSAIGVPLIHIAEVTANAILTKGLQKVALLGTKYTMQLPFYTRQLKAQGIETILPNEADIEFINTTIYDEMGKGLFLAATKTAYLKIIDDLVAKGAQGVILGCTEIPILIQQTDCDIPLFDTGLLHAIAAVDFALTK
ncbi:aspartate/glutamate racemase family protein [Parasediminibacterium paludis]|uniref:Aspartate/glutamate racemase family protein n=1 Tax=Parasediminibacterium paludis TaxID=908966 RepID=A0ABV8Q0R3_9BACT